MSSVRLNKTLTCLIILLSFIPYCYSNTVKVYKVGVENINYMPFYMGSTDKGSYQGYSKEVLDLFAKSQNIKFEYVPMPVIRLFAEFIKKRSVDFKYPDNPAWSKDYWPELKENEQIHYSVPDVITKTGIAVRLEDNLKSVNICKHFAIIPGFTPQSYMEFLSRKDVMIVNPPNINNLIKSIIIKRVNCIYISKEVLTYNLQNSFDKKDSIIFQEHLPYDIQYFSLSSIMHPDLIKAYNLFLKENKNKIALIAKRFGIIK